MRLYFPRGKSNSRALQRIMLNYYKHKILFYLKLGGYHAKQEVPINDEY